MFCQLLLIICSLVFVGNPGSSVDSPVCSKAQDVAEVTKIVQADLQYGWQVSASSVAAYDVPAN